jgi:hypothetical protein
MPIRAVDDPPEARDLATSLLQDQFPGGGGAAGDVEFSGKAPSIGAVEVYNLTPRELADGRLDDPTPTGWRYVQIREDAPVGEIVEVLAHNRAEPELASFTSGRLAGRMSETASRAESELSDEPDEFEPRVLRVPEIHMEALWMHSPDPNVADRFYGLPTSQRELINDAFMDAAVSRAQSYLGSIAAFADGETEEPKPVSENDPRQAEPRGEEDEEPPAS